MGLRRSRFGCFTGQDRRETSPTAPPAKTKVLCGTLCDKCQSILKSLPVLGDEDDEPKDGVEYGFSLTSIKDQRGQGCYICAALWSILPSNISSWPIEAQFRIDFVLHRDPATDIREEILELLVDLSLSHTDRDEIFQTTKTFTLHVDSDIDSRLKPISSDSTNGHESFEIAKSWVDECIRNHGNCRGAIEEYTGWRPTRLLDLSNAAKGYIRLRESSSSSKRNKARYATLSHRWGDYLSRRKYILTTANIQQYKRSIDIAALPLNYQQTIDASQRLNIRYLWIDSLCILQDHRDDWQKEVAEMDKTYTFSYLNISATYAENIDQGLYQGRNAKALTPPRINLRSIGPTIRTYRLLDNEMWHDDVENAPLNSRAWVLQERFLPARVLHFARSQIYWECFQMDAAEVLPNGLPSGRTQMNNKFKVLEPWYKLGQEVKSSAEEEDFEIIVFWSSVVERYTRANLTFESDRLVAISGIARVIAKARGYTYISGMWEVWLEHQLLWHVKNSAKSHRPKSYRAPSWSWASLEASIVQPRIWTGGRLVAKIIEAHVSSPHDDNFGIIEGGFVSIQGYLRRVTFGYVACDWFEEIEGQRVVEEASEDSISESHGGGSGIKLDGQLNDLPIDQLFFCMPVYHDESSPELRGLILSRGRSEDNFTRIGTFWTREAAHIMSMLPDIQEEAIKGGIDWHDTDHERKLQSTITIV